MNNLDAKPPCDCTVFCGDDNRLENGLVLPCDGLLQSVEREKMRKCREEMMFKLLNSIVGNNSISHDEEIKLAEQLLNVR